MEILAILVQFSPSSVLVLACFILLLHLGQSICPSVLSMIWNRLEDEYPWPSGSDIHYQHYDSSPFAETAVESQGFDHVKWAFDRAQSTRLYRRSPAPEGDGEHAVQCVFCLCDLEDGEEIRELKCEHLFHRPCLDRWVGYGRVCCPLCRKSLSSKVAEAEVSCGEGVDNHLSTADVMLADDPHGA
ncbi:hypothetical protein Taro_021132 [Colocasia esculenta]|uniref:RING-type domain-containing protein n=1 Tax=Colocasia esculenta TaxID=4460 RepID=A0A843V7B9_COLES|nr:hypothetical protein [Colocasia esculenta]